MNCCSRHILRIFTHSCHSYTYTYQNTHLRVCTHTSTHTCLHTVHTDTQTDIQAGMHKCTRTPINTSNHIYVWINIIYKYKQPHVWINMIFMGVLYVCVRESVSVCTCSCACACLYVCHALHRVLQIIILFECIQCSVLIIVLIFSVYRGSNYLRLGGQLISYFVYFRQSLRVHCYVPSAPPSFPAIHPY